MDNDTTYNGWANRATWLVNLHLTNDQGLYGEAAGIVAERYQDELVPDHVLGIVDDHTGKVGRAADELKDYVERITDTEAGPFVADLIGQALADVDWHEIAEGLLDE